MRAILFLLLASCTHDVSAFDRVEVQPEARDLDILFVFDDSADRGTYDQMSSQLDFLQSRLKDVDGQVPSLHVGVVTTDLGIRGSTDALPRPKLGNCDGDGKAAQLVKFGADLNGSFLEDLRGDGGERIRNFASDDLTLELGRLTNPAVGTANAGCEFEQPLEAMRRALDPRTNPGFIRRNALLSIVFLTTDDDCSFARASMLDPNDGSLGPLMFRCTEQGVTCDEDLRTPGVKTNCRPREDSDFMVDVAEYAAFLDTFKSDPSDIIVSAVAGKREPFEVKDFGGPVLATSCQGPGGSAVPAVRIGALVDSFGGVVVDGCGQEAAYQQIASPIVNNQRSCFPALRRSDGEDCIVLEVAGGVETELARCADGSPSPCWYTFADDAACPGGDNVGIAVHRGNTRAPMNARIQATCFAK